MDEQYETLRQMLITRARDRNMFFYGDLAPKLGLDMSRDADRAEIGRILGEVSKHEHANGRPLLSAIVVAKDGGTPGSGFFKLAKELGLFDLGDKDTYWMTEVERIYQYWAVN